jgi:hypothetical protein
MRRVEFTSPISRAIMPIIGGIAGFILLFGVTWILASTSTKNRQSQPQTVPQTFEIGEVKDVAKSIDQDGPILYPDLRDATGKRSIVIDHTGTNPAKGWQVYYAYPADKSSDCLVAQIKKTHTFTDCDGRVLQVDQLQKPSDVTPIVEGQTTLLIDLQS